MSSGIAAACGLLYLTRVWLGPFGGFRNTAPRAGEGSSGWICPFGKRRPRLAYVRLAFVKEKPFGRRRLPGIHLALAMPAYPAESFVVKIVQYLAPVHPCTCSNDCNRLTARETKRTRRTSNVHRPVLLVQLGNVRTLSVTEFCAFLSLW